MCLLFRIYLPQDLKIPYVYFTITLVDRLGIEPRIIACKAIVLPLSLSALFCFLDNNIVCGRNRIRTYTPFRTPAFKAGEMPITLYPSLAEELGIEPRELLHSQISNLLQCHYAILPNAFILFVELREGLEPSTSVYKTVALPVKLTEHYIILS